MMSRCFVSLQAVFNYWTLFLFPDIPLTTNWRWSGYKMQFHKLQASCFCLLLLWIIQKWYLHIVGRVYPTPPPIAPGAQEVEHTVLEHRAECQLMCVLTQNGHFFPSYSLVPGGNSYRSDWNSDGPKGRCSHAITAFLTVLLLGMCVFGKPDQYTAFPVLFWLWEKVVWADHNHDCSLGSHCKPPASSLFSS